MRRHGGGGVGRPARATLGASLAVALLVTAPLAGQERAAGTAPDPVPQPLDVGGMWAGAVLGWAGGFLGGAVLGYTLETETGPAYASDWEGLGGALMGGLAGSTVLTPVLAHRLGGGEGDLLIALAASVVSGAAMVAVVVASDGKLLLALPVGQIWTSVFAENRTAQRNRARR